MELSIANQIMQKDPQRALQIARKNLKTKLNANVLNTLRFLRRQNPELAAELANEIAGKVLEEKLLKNIEAANVAMGLLRTPERPVQPLGNPHSNYVPSKPANLLSDTQYRELIQKALNEALSFSLPSPQVYTPERDAAFNLLTGLRQFGSELDNISPGASAAVEKKLSELSAQRASGRQQLDRKSVV